MQRATGASATSARYPTLSSRYPAGRCRTEISSASVSVWAVLHLVLYMERINDGHVAKSLLGLVSILLESALARSISLLTARSPTRRSAYRACSARGTHSAHADESLNGVGTDADSASSRCSAPLTSQARGAPATIRRARRGDARARHRRFCVRRCRPDCVRTLLPAPALYGFAPSAVIALRLPGGE